MMCLLFNDILQLQFFLTFSSLLFHKDARSEYGGLTIYDDAFTNYLWVKVFDDNVFAIIKSLFFFSFVCVLTWSLLGIKKGFGHAQIGLFEGFNSKFPTSIASDIESMFHRVVCFTAVDGVVAKRELLVDKVPVQCQASISCYPSKGKNG